MLQTGAAIYSGNDWELSIPYIYHNNSWRPFILKYCEVRLPNEYQEVEYLQSNGTQYINTGASADSFDVEFQYTTQYSGNTVYSILGARTADNTGIIGVAHWAGELVPAPPDVAVGNQDTHRHTVQTGAYFNNTLYYDNKNITTYSSSYYITDNNIYLFTSNKGSGLQSRSSCKIYYVKLYKKGKLIRNFVPCYRKSDSVAGMYDKVTNSFYTNNGTGTFTVGADINLFLPNIYQQVEYLEASGTQYINTGTAADSYDADFQYTEQYSGSTVYSILGTRNSDSSKIFAIAHYNGLLLPAPPDQSVGAQDTNRHRIQNGSYFNNKVIYDGTEALSYSTYEYNTGYTVYLFGENNEGSAYARSKCRIFAVKLYLGGALVRDFIPCYRKSDSVAGMYDKVNNIFYTNSGTGSFTVGADTVRADIETSFVDWKTVCGAGTLMIPFITSENEDFVTSDDKFFLVRMQESTIKRLITSDGKVFKTSNNETFYVQRYIRYPTVLDSITVITPPTKTSYLPGEVLDAEGMVVQGTFSNKFRTTTVNLLNQYLTCPIIEENQTSVPISFTYEGITKTAQVNITNNSILSSISVITAPTKTEYIENEVFDPTGLKVQANISYNNTTITKDVPIDKISYSSNALTTSDSSITISYTYNNTTKTTSIPIEVYPSHKKIRYVKLWHNGNSVNNYSHVVEFQAFNLDGTNVALNKTPITTQGSWSSINKVTDGNTATGQYADGAQNQIDEMLIDFGSVQRIASMTIWRYYSDGRKYNCKILSSENGAYWDTIFDSSIEGTYAETSSGRTFTF